jgi:hypothetical protein
MESDLHYFADRYFWALFALGCYLALTAVMLIIHFWEKRNEHQGDHRIS